MLDTIKQIYLFFVKVRFLRYLIMGGIATLIDWSSFYILALILGIYYLLALAISFSLASIAHYTLNKLFTFRCKSKKIAKQFSVSFSISIISLILSSIIMFALVDLLLIQKMISRIMTTFIVLIANYSMHKYFTFNRRFFK